MGAAEAVLVGGADVVVVGVAPLWVEAAAGGIELAEPEMRKKCEICLLHI